MRNPELDTDLPPVTIKAGDIMENYIYYPPGPSELESIYSRYVPGDYDECGPECGTNDRVLYATWLLVAALVGAAAFVLWKVAR